MASKKLKNNMPFWYGLEKMPLHQRKAIFSSLTKDQVADIEEIFANVLNGVIKIDKPLLEKMKKRKHIIKELGAPRVPLSRKKKIIQTGNGLPILGILLATLPLLVEHLK